MNVTQLELKNFRGFDQLSIKFQEGINVIAGINGAGKSTILDAIKIAARGLDNVEYLIWTHGDTAENVLPPVHKNVSAKPEKSDIQTGADEVALTVNFILNGISVRYEALRSRWDYKIGTVGDVRNQTQPVENRSQILPQRAIWRREELSSLTFVVYFGAQRSVYAPYLARRNAVHGEEAIHQGALDERRAELDLLADWFRAIDGSPLFDIVKRAIANFLPDMVIDYEEHARVRELVDSESGDRVRVNVSKLGILKGGSRNAILESPQLSDGERGLLAMVMDIARRLAIANPNSIDPLAEGRACILIDEIELHLHPQWQREVLSRLAETFPSCQFIITTHSPQVLGEVQPERVFLLTESGVESPSQSYGMDSAWILRHLMDADDRSDDIKDRVRLVEIAIRNKDIDSADREISLIAARVHGSFDRLQALRTQVEIMKRLRA